MSHQSPQVLAMPDIRNDRGEVVGRGTIALHEDGMTRVEWPDMSRLPVGTYTMDEANLVTG